MNFAAVFTTPTIFFCQNNGWAISMPRERQTASPTIAQKADGYGMPGTLVDGNDVLAVLAATRAALERARGGQGPTLIEGITYRMAAHTTADDAGRYRDEEEVAAWRARDPLERVRRHLESHDAWDPAWQADLEEAASAAVEAAVEEADAMFAEPTAPLRVQRSMAAGEGTP
jgi:pyruvate dehydrogenase E1 component alpha subunit